MLDKSTFLPMKPKMSPRWGDEVSRGEVQWRVSMRQPRVPWALRTPGIDKGPIDVDRQQSSRLGLRIEILYDDFQIVGPGQSRRRRTRLASELARVSSTVPNVR